ncbi:MAG: TIGR02530 family flagellar biosynthesis protein [bacterium]
MNERIHMRVPADKGVREEISVSRGSPAAKSSFKEILARKQQESEAIKFSGHALERLRLRNIKFSREELKEIGRMAEQVKAKGGQDALFIMKDLALIVNIPNKTVVTVIDGPSLAEHVFTKIDSAVVR